jgi:PAS domain S-box-containing protein
MDNGSRDSRHNETGTQVGLSEREREVLFLAGEGLTDKEIALRLDIGQKTVRTYWDRMRAKLGAASRTEVLAKAVHAALDAVQESEQRLRLFVDNMPVMFNAYDEELNIILVNQECERLTGYEPDEFYNGQAYERGMPDDDYRALVMGRFREIRGDYRDQEIEVTCADGTKRMIAWSSRAKEAPIEGWASWAIGIDVTQRVQAQKSLAQSEQNFRRLLETSSQGVWIVDTQHRTLFANQRLAEMFACSVEDILSNDETTYLDDQSRQLLRELIATGPIGGTRTRFTFRFKRKDGVDLWAYVDVAPMFDLDGDLQGHAAMLTDISRSKALEHSNSMIRDLYTRLLEKTDVGYIRFDRQMSVVDARLPGDLVPIGSTSDDLEKLLAPFEKWASGFASAFGLEESSTFDGTIGSGKSARAFQVALMPEPTPQQRVGYVLALLTEV